MWQVATALVRTDYRIFPSAQKALLFSTSLKHSATEMPGGPERVSSHVCYPVCHHSQDFFILEIVGVGWFLLSFIPAYNSQSYLRNMKASLPGWMHCPELSGIQRQRSASSNQSFLGNSLLIWGRSYGLQRMKWIFEALVKEKIYKGHVLLKSTYSISREPHCITQNMWQHHHKSSWPIMYEAARVPNGKSYPQESKKLNAGLPTDVEAMQKKTRDSEWAVTHVERTVMPTASSKKRGGFLQPSLHGSRATWC